LPNERYVIIFIESTLKWQRSEKRMRYTKTHKDETRARLLNSSRAIAKKGGFDSTGIDALMSAIGLSGGAFYNHFPSKRALFQAVIEKEIENSSEMLAGDQQASSEHMEKCLRSYLSSFHALHPEAGCVLPTLGPEIARAGPEVRTAVELGLKRTQASWRTHVGDADTAWAFLAECVGALVLSRAVESDETRKEILDANWRFLDKILKQSRAAAKPKP
jgi:AcrR family transcriptional regulator